jgi:predicted nucleic acid-binding protein
VKEYFADSFCFLALNNPEDDAHKSARAAIEGRSGLIVTTAWVLTEVADALAAPPNRRQFIELLDFLTANPDAIILPPSQPLFQAGLMLYRHRPDKEWSLTDCISFVVMKERGITEALTGDHHFEQAGFAALLK